MVDIFELEPLENSSNVDNVQEKSKRSSRGGKSTEAKSQPFPANDNIVTQQTPKSRPSIATIKKGVTEFDLHNKFNLSDLQEFCKQHGLKTSGTKKHLIKQIRIFVDPENETENVPIGGFKNRKLTKGKRTRETAARPPISVITKGMTSDYLHNTFNASDLQQFLKTRSAPSTGQKKVLIKRVLEFLETGTTQPPKKRRKIKDYRWW